MPLECALPVEVMERERTPVMVVVRVAEEVVVGTREPPADCVWLLEAEAEGEASAVKEALAQKEDEEVAWVLSVACVPGLGVGAGLLGDPDSLTAPGLVVKARLPVGVVQAVGEAETEGRPRPPPRVVVTVRVGEWETEEEEE